MTARGADCGQLMSREPRPRGRRPRHTALSSPLRLILMPFTSPSRDPRVLRRLPKLEGMAAPFGVPAASADDAALSALAAGDNTWGGGTRPRTSTSSGRTLTL